MRHIVPAHVAAKFLDAYPKKFAGNLELLSYSENATFRVDTNVDERFVLRVHRCDYHSQQDIASELAWLDNLREHGLKVPEAVVGLNGSVIQSGTGIQGEARHFVLFQWIDGVAPDPEDNLEASFSRLGAINAKLHLHSRTWTRPKGFQRMTWDHSTMIGPNAHWGRWQDNTNIQAAEFSVVEQCVSQIKTELENYGKESDRFGLIHADLRLANLLLDGERTRVIDFDDCGFGWFMHDLAAALTFIEHHPKAESWIAHWLDGYSQEAPLERADLEILPTLILQRRIQVLAWLASHGDSRESKTLGRPWVEATISLCNRYLDGNPVGGSQRLEASIA